MDFDKSLLAPFYEFLCTIIPCTELHSTNSKLKPNKRNFKGYHEFEFYMIDECNLSISRAESFEEMDKRVVINFYKCNEINEIVVNEIPPHLKIRVNHYQIPLSEYLPHDNCRNTGRRFPRSIDITDPVFLSKTRENQCIINWDQDRNDGKYYFVLNLVRVKSCEELCAQLMNNSIYPFENTQDKFLKTDSNQKNALITSLICPISLIRINIPVRGEHCNHLQCFDLVTYLTINFQKPNWQCPICDQKTAYNNLKIDNLILAVLNDKQSNSTRKIIFNVHGQWKSCQKSKSIFIDVPKSIKRKATDEENSEKTAKKRCHIVSNEPGSPVSRLKSTKSNSLYHCNDSQPQIVYDIQCILETLTPVIHNDKNIPKINPYSMIFDPISKISTSVVDPPINCIQDTFEKDKDRISVRSKSVTSQSSSDQSDVEIVKENFRLMPGTKVEYKIIKKESKYYTDFENYISRENRSIIVFDKAEDIPNILKGDATEKRKLVILKMGLNTKIPMSSFNPDSGAIEIHAGSKHLDLYIRLEKEYANYQITLEASSSIHLICSDEWRERITISFTSSEKSVVAFEIFETEDHRNEYHRDHYNITENMCVEHKSFLNRPLSLNEIRRKIRFIDVKSAIGKYCSRNLPVAVVVLDYDGNELFREIVTPRGMVKAYRQDINGLVDSSIMGNIDEEECTKVLRTLLYDTILVGIRVSSALFSLRISKESILGIRELSTGLCFDKLQECNAFRSFWTLKCLAKKVICKDIHVEIGQYRCRENVNAIRDIYLAVENQWVDHIHPDGTQEVNIDYNSLERLNMKNKITAFKHIDSPMSVTIDNDLDDEPDIELMLEEDIDFHEEISNEGVSESITNNGCINDEDDIDSSNNHLSGGEINQYKENDCSKSVIEDRQDYVDDTKEIIYHVQDSVDNNNDSVIIHADNGRTSIDFQSIDVCVTNPVDSPISTSNEETVNEISIDSLNHLSEGKINEFDENDCNKSVTEDCQDKSIILLDNVDDTKEIIHHLQDSVDNINDSVIIQVDNDRKSLNFQSIAVCANKPVDSPTSISSEETVNEILSFGEEYVNNHENYLNSSKESLINATEKEKIDNDLSINDANDSIISIDFPITAMDDNSLINENYFNNIDNGREIRRENLFNIENSFRTSTEIVSQNTSNETILLNNENINNSDKVDLFIDLDETSNVVLSNNDNENNKLDISIYSENSTNEISTNQQDYVNVNDNFTITLDYDEIIEDDILDKDASVNNVIVQKSINLDEISHNTIPVTCKYVNNLENSIINYDMEENVEMVCSSNNDQFINDSDSGYLFVNSEETKSINQLCIDDSNIGGSHNKDNVIMGNKFTDLQKSNGYPITAGENPTKLRKDSNNDANGSKNQYLNMENYQQDDRFLDITKYNKENQISQNGSSFNSILYDDLDENEMNTYDKSISSKDLELSGDRMVNNDRNNFQSKLQVPWSNFTNEFNMAKIKTIVLSKDEMVTSVKMGNENGSVNYLVKGMFYCPTTDTWTNVELDKESILELKQISNKYDECKDIDSIDLTYDSS